MPTIDLAGRWELRSPAIKEIVPATVPGCVHLDLRAAGVIPDPFYRDNERRLQWVGEGDWTYSREFDVPPEFLRHDRVLLRCEGLDTLAAVSINSQKIASTDNMFRTWEFDIISHLKPGRNSISIRFVSAIDYVKKREKIRHLPAWKGPLEIQGGNWLRKEPCSFGWDWGPVLVTAGIWRPIKIIAYNTARLSDVHITQRHRPDGHVTLTVDAVIECFDKKTPLNIEATVDRAGNVLRTAAPVKNGRARLVFEIADPELWCPSGMGRQPLYAVTVNLTDNQGKVLDTAVRRIGLRTLSLRRKKDRWGESFGFAVNGVPFFAKGANWIPSDAFLPRLAGTDYRDLLESAAAANMNMLRVWGGGIYEADVFYDICDELGLCVWQDFMFACSTYPAFDDSFLAGVRAEAEDNVKRLRHHPCLVLWCGNNELEPGLLADNWDDAHMSWDDYKKVFDVLLPGVVKQLDPGRDYWPCSPHVPHEDRMKFADDRWGDAHLWQVWHGRQPFEWYRTSNHRFVSEFGFQSFPEPRTVHAYTEPADRNVSGYVMELHQRSDIGNTAIMTSMLDWFRLPKDFDSTLWLSQILQGIGMQYAVEHWRRRMPRTMGALYWQLNDCWPVASWSSIDYRHRWKALHYLARRFYAPLLLSAIGDVGNGAIELHVTSDLPEPRDGALAWRVTDIKGALLLAGDKPIVIPSRASHRVHTLKLAGLVKANTPRDLLVWLDLSAGGKVVSSQLVTLARPKHLELFPPDIKVKNMAEKGGGVTLTLTAQHPALWVWLELAGEDARFSNNFFHLFPGEPYRVVAESARLLSPEEVSGRLRVRSLVDTYQ